MDSPRFPRHARVNAAVLVAVLVMALSCLVAYGPTLLHLRQTGGTALYPLDDTYIHLVLARTFVETGVWGVAPDVPAAASSSPMWTLLLASGRLLVPNDTLYSWLPLVLNTVAAIAVIAVWSRILGKSDRPIASLVVLTVGSALPMLVLLGLEHVVHCLATLLLAWTAAGCITNDVGPRPLALAGLSAVATATRYESLFLILPIAIAFALRRRQREALAVTAGALLIVIGFGTYWVTDGGTFLPNALMLKGPIGADAGLAVSAKSVLANLLSNVLGSPVGAPKGLIVLTLVALAQALWVLSRFANARDRQLALLVLAAAAMQTVFGRFGWLYRYEAWLVVLAAVTIVRLSRAIALSPRAAALAPVLLLAALAPRAWAAVQETAYAPSDRLWEHFGPAEVFRNSSLSGQPILANDVGVLAYVHPGHVVDFYGLADNLPVHWRRAGTYGSQQVAELARRRKARIGVVQLCWPEVSSRFPSGWQLIEVWQGPRNVVFGDRTVAFVALPEAASSLAAALNQAPTPSGVRRWTQGDLRIARFNEADDKRAATYAGVCQF